MAEDWKLQVSLKKGNDLLNIRAQTADELEGVIEDAKTRPDLAPFFGGTAPSSPVAAAAGPGPAGDAGGAAATVPTDAEAVANIEKHLGAKPAEDPATAAQIAVAAKKSGKSVEELQGISAAEAKALIAGGK